MELKFPESVLQPKTNNKVDQVEVFEVGQKRKINCNINNKLTKYFKSENTLEFYLSKWSARNGFSFKSISECDELAVFLTYRNLEMPKSRETIAQRVEDFFKAKFNDQQKEICLKLEKDNCLAVV
jgi:hypothetical protein